jgi:hypothetical protein
MDKKACLRAELCKSKLLCSGEVETYEEAEASCTGKARTRNLSCDDRLVRAREAMEKTRQMIQDGEADLLGKQAGKIAADIKACSKNPTVLQLTTQLVKELKALDGQYYYVNEGRVVIKTMNALRAELGTTGTKEAAVAMATEGEESTGLSAFLDTDIRRTTLKPTTVATREQIRES